MIILPRHSEKRNSACMQGEKLIYCDVIFWAPRNLTTLELSLLKTKLVIFLVDWIQPLIKYIDYLTTVIKQSKMLVLCKKDREDCNLPSVCVRQVALLHS